MENKNYVKCSLVDTPTVFGGYFENYLIPDTVLSKLARDLGFSFDMYTTLSNLDKSTADKLVESMSKKSQRTEISFLVDFEINEVLGYSLDNRDPLLNVDFMKRVKSLVETSNEIKLDESYHYSGDTKSSVIIKKVDPIEIDFGSHKATYDVGVLVVNDELESAYCRLVVYIDNHPIYLPASYYSTTTNRYRKSTGTSAEALEVLILKIIDDLRGDELKYKLSEFHIKHKANKEVLTTYEEYNTLLRAMMKVPSIIEDNSVLSSLKTKYDEFEQKYTHLDEQKSSYIWRCTAIGELSIGNLVHITAAILNELGAPSMEYFNVRELLGEYLSTSRIVANIAK